MHFRKNLVWAGLLIAGLLGAHNTAAQSSGSSTTAKPDSANGGVSSTSPTDLEYHIGPQDIVKIDVWKEMEITRTIPVRPDGKISLPLLNDVQASGLTAMQLAANIREGLMKFLTNPQVTVTVTEINSRRVYLTGEVAHNGAIPLLPNMTALQAIASGGGFTQFAKQKDIYILRVENGKQIKHPFNYKEVIKGKRPEDNILLQPGDIIVVP
jgi:polysaccharide export outer membrane protein